MFSFLVTVLLAVVVAALVLPFIRKTDLVVADHEASDLDEERVNLTIERQTLVVSLSEIEVEFGQERLTEQNYAEQKLALEHRLLEILDRFSELDKIESKIRDKKTSTATGTGKNWASVGVVTLLLIGGSTGGYQLVQWKFEQAMIAENRAGNIPAAAPIDPVKMVARLEKKLKDDPNDLQGQMMIGRSYMAMERWDDAEVAWKKVVELDERNYTAHYRLGEIILSNPKTGNQQESLDALAHFEKALISVPQDASILWAKGIALLQLGRNAEADEIWAEAYGYLPAGSEGANMVKKALEDLRSGRMPSSG